MDRGKNIKSSIPHSCVDFTVAVLGNTTSDPTIPADGAFTPTTATYPVRANGVSKVTAEAPSRSSTGVYVITYAHLLPNALFASASVLSAGGSPTGDLGAIVTVLDGPNRQITVEVTTNTSNALTDLGTSDMLVIYVHAQDSSV